MFANDAFHVLHHVRVPRNLNGIGGNHGVRFGAVVIMKRGATVLEKSLYLDFNFFLELCAIWMYCETHIPKQYQIRKYTVK